MIYELLIRGKADGTISGSHAIDFDANGNIGVARPVKAGDWPAVASALNGALVATNAELSAALTEKETTLTTLSAAILEIKAAPDLETAKAHADHAMLDEKAKKVVALDAQIAALQAEREGLIQ